MVALKQVTRACQRNHTNTMTKRIPVCKNMTGNHEQDAEEESSASEAKMETVVIKTISPPLSKKKHKNKRELKTDL